MMRGMSTVLPVLLAALLLAPAGLQAHDTGTDLEQALNVPQLIDRDLADSRISYSEALRLKITWFKCPDQLPESYRGALGVTVRCGTPILLEIDRNFHRLEKEDRAILAGMGLSGLPDILGGRPDYNYTLESSIIPLRVHYETEDHLERAQKTLEVYEYSWQQECGVMGFYEPPGDYGVDGSDDYDVYLSSTGSGVLGYTSPGQQVEETWWNDRTSFIVHSRNLSSDLQISNTGCHEFQHACQMAMAYEESATFYENTAVWVEPHVYFEYANDAWSYGWYCQRQPEMAICWFDNSGLFQYGGFVWPEYLADRFDGWGTEFIRRIWEDSRDEPGADNTNYFDAIVNLAEEYEPGGPRGTGWHLHDLLTEFAEWRYFCRNEADDAHYTHGSEFHRVTVDALQDHGTLPAICPAELPRMPDFYAMNYVRFDRAVTTQPTLKIFFEGEREWISTPVYWRLLIIKYYELGVSYDIATYDVPTDTGNLLIEVTEADQCERLTMVVINLGAGGTNPGYEMPEANYYYMAWAEDDPNMSLLVAAPGPSAGNAAKFRNFLSSDTSLMFADEVHSEDFGHGLNVAAGDIDADGVEEIVVGYESGPTAPPEFYAYRLNGYGIYGTQQTAYGVDKYGVNVACGDIDGDSADEIITGPGPGPPFGPQVRGWDYDRWEGTSAIAAVNYFAYGTLKYGVNVACGDIDADGYDEIVTGAGPGAVFGPHVRGWDYDGSGSVTPIGGVSYFAYGVPKWGTNVACGDVDGDGIDEIITGAGPGAVYGPHVRGWNYDGGTLEPMGGVNFLAYGTNKYGVNVTCGDVDNDGIDEIITGPGPGQVFGAHVRGWNYDGDSLAPISTISFFAYDSDSVRYGANVAVAEMQVD